jgi:hypothetical protein
LLVSQDIARLDFVANAHEGIGPHFANFPQDFLAFGCVNRSAAVFACVTNQPNRFQRIAGSLLVWIFNVVHFRDWYFGSINVVQKIFTLCAA